MIKWQKLIDNFIKNGINPNQLALLSGCMTQDICDLMNEVTIEPPFSTGLKLLDIHLDYFPTKHNFIIED